ncbi:MAG: class II SORL domain-containing protein [Candidatus Heimdallarchaeota archaeon]|nr:class II SORL domain-containing protein [Candidatus Heimdallarchaeota archaeon]MCK5143328.1 class II SORL domain-containing protein [Candidatus Heimdallarchaeota archaeon]
MELYGTADWKTEKHVPVIEIADVIKAGEKALVTISVGKEIAHPNKTEHHISWIKLMFWPEDEKYPYQLGLANFDAHGASIKGSDTSGVYSEPYAVFQLKTDKPGKLIATSYCNIHGFWKYEKEVKVE